MNVSFGWQGRMVMCVGLFLVSAGSSRLATAQLAPNNPLRSTTPRVVEDTTRVQQASATEPVRAHVRSAASNSTTRPHSTTQARTVAGRVTTPPAPAHYQPVSYGKRTVQRPPMDYVPAHRVAMQTQVESGVPTEVIPEGVPMGEPGDMMFEGLPGEGEVLGSDCCDGPVADCGGCGQCGSCSSCNGCLIPCPRLSLDNFEIFAGAQGFTGPLNRGETGSFGFHYGVNWGAPVPCLFSEPLGMQVGYRGVNSNFSGTSFSEDSRHQSYLTAGLFRRVDWGLQGGVVIDLLSDDWYYDKLELSQLRGELSWVYPQCHELGFWFAAGIKTGAVESAVLVDGARQPLIENYEATDLMAFFYRRRLEALGGGYGRLFAGFTGTSEGLIGADFQLPLTPSLALQSEFTYLVPKDGNNQIAHLEEAWNVGITLVWYPGCRKSIGNDYFRPLFDVADNGNFIVRPVEQ